MAALEALTARLEAEGHTVEWGMSGPVSENRPGDPGWWLRVDGEIVATGDAIGDLQAALERMLGEVEQDP